MRKRNMIVKVHLNEEEHRYLKEQVELSGFTTEQYLRRLIAGKEIRQRPPEKMTDLLRQLSAIGNNINQIAKVANTYKNISQDELKNMQRMIKDIWLKVEEL